MPCCRYAHCDSPQAAGKSSGKTLTNTAAPHSPHNIIVYEHPGELPNVELNVLGELTRPLQVREHLLDFARQMLEVGLAHK